MQIWCAVSVVLVPAQPLIFLAAVPSQVLHHEATVGIKKNPGRVKIWGKEMCSHKAVPVLLGATVEPCPGTWDILEAAGLLAPPAQGINP